MSEVFVDLQYRGLPLGSRVRLSQVEDRQGYLELPAPMPVGTMISIQLDSQQITAQVTEVHEQIGGSDRPPGMRVRPVLDGEPKVAWWMALGGAAANVTATAVAAPAPTAPAATATAAAAAATALAATAVAPAAGELSAREQVPEPETTEPTGDPDDEPEIVIEQGNGPAARASGAGADDQSDDQAGEQAVAAVEPEASGATSDAGGDSNEGGEMPDPPASAGDASPRGRKRRRANRR